MKPLHMGAQEAPAPPPSHSSRSESSPATPAPPTPPKLPRVVTPGRAQRPRSLHHGPAQTPPPRSLLQSPVCLEVPFSRFGQAVTHAQTRDPKCSQSNERLQFRSTKSEPCACLQRLTCRAPFVCRCREEKHWHEPSTLGQVELPSHLQRGLVIRERRAARAPQQARRSPPPPPRPPHPRSPHLTLRHALCQAPARRPFCQKGRLSAASSQLRWWRCAFESRCSLLSRPSPRQQLLLKELSTQPSTLLQPRSPALRPRCSLRSRILRSAHPVISPPPPLQIPAPRGHRP